MKSGVSIIIPTYNRARFLEGVSLPSVFRQTRSAVECIVVDDGSTDDTKAVVEHFLERYQEIPSTYLYQRNAGVAAARNAGIKIAKGEWVLCLDSDDALLPGALDVLVREAERTGADVVTGMTWRMAWKTGRIKGIGGSTPSSVILKKKVFLDYGPYDEDRNIIEDIDHVYRLEPVFERGDLRISRMTVPVAVYFSHEGQVTSLADAEKLSIKAAAMIRKWESRMPKNPRGLANLARLWRNRGVYKTLAGNRREGFRAFARSLDYRWSFGTAVLSLLTVVGKPAFRSIVLPLKAFLEVVSFQIRRIRFFEADHAEARRSLNEARKARGKIS